MGQQVQETPIPSKLKDVEAYMKEHVGVGESFDLGFRQLTIFKRKIDIFYLTGMCDTQYIIEILEMLVSINDVERHSQSKLFEIVENRLVHQQVSKGKTMNEVVTQLLSGLIVVFMEDESEAFIVDVRSYPGRTPQEPDTEKVVRGSRDGYTENIIENTSLTRRRVRDERLRHEIFQVGTRSKTDICISYIKDVADPGLVKLIKKELKNINIDGLSMADKSVEEFLVSQGKNPFPLVRYTERPDVASAHLFEGHVLIMVDTSPSMIITPTTYFHHVQHAEEYRQSPIVGSFVRWVRYLGIFLSVFLLPFWLVMVMDPTLLPQQLQFIGPQDDSNIPVFLQLLIADIGIEFLRIAAIHTPTPLSTAMGLIAAVLIGQIAIDVGLFIPEVILYVSVAAIGSFSTPSYELSVANKISRVVLLIITAIFGVKGLVIGFTLYILLLTSTRSLNTPYFWPLIPFNPQAMAQILLRVAVPLAKNRPSIVHPQNNHNQPKSND
ncbi:stage V sporulation protein AF [Pontibacillus halophilus JSM 076056 = DSM 19796]|uniref:Stage V sporulation protein AF n=1 Tax=Pontibacillus halophilus JSM 076056 = DSM 19796 TaxID=1385510 RepID=A0A0A5GJP1_9BACI|nr:spore germination protein [Pontibacillus halophilus]KGX92219.1 stage V sporulation protein AF [Pontibacillus halophilus JSM 076056 = DSM 19796]